MKSRLMCLAIPFVLMSGALASAQVPSRYQQVYEITVKPGQYVVALGKPSPTYRVALNFSSWADREAWSTIPAMMAKAYGQQEAERLMKEGSGAIERSVIEVWESLPGSSANQGGAPGPVGKLRARADHSSGPRQGA